MKELLEKFVKLAPKEWGVTMFEVAKANAVFHRVRNAADDGVLYLDLDSDRESTESLVFLLDHLEDSGYGGALIHWPAGDTKYCYSADDVLLSETPGKARIEAVVRACVALWEVKENV